MTIPKIKIPKITIPEMTTKVHKTLLQVVSLLIIAVGIGMIYLPAGVIALGLVGLNYSIVTPVHIQGEQETTE